MVDDRKLLNLSGEKWESPIENIFLENSYIYFDQQAPIDMIPIVCSNNSYLFAVCEHAYSLSQNLDPNSEGRGVLQFKTGLMSVIKV